jgi:hypothetical protein
MAEGLTAEGAAACRIELPCSTACTIRSRRSRDRGTVVVSSNPLTPSILEADRPIPRNTELLQASGRRARHLTLAVQSKIIVAIENSAWLRGREPPVARRIVFT